MKNMKKAALFLLIIIVFAFVFVSCDTKDDVTYYQETVVGKYGDGISLVGLVTPEPAPVYFTDVQRVEKSVYFDTRLEGWHFTGVYVVKGEQITVRLPDDKADGSVTLAVGRYQAKPYTVSADSALFTFTSTVSGLLDVNLGNCYGDAFWQMTISGGIAASYYRLGLDRVAEWKDSIDYAAVDSANVRIYLPVDRLDAAEDVEKAAAWWRSFCEYADGLLIGNFGEDKLSPTDIFVDKYASVPYFDAANDVLRVPESYADVMLDYEALSTGAAWDLMLEFCRGKYVYAGLDAGFAAEVAQIVAAGAFVRLTDGILAEDSGDEYWINNAYDCLVKSLDGQLFSYGDLALYVNLIHSFGEKKVVGVAVDYAVKRTGIGGNDIALPQTSLAQYYCDVFAEEGTDLAPFMNDVFGMSVTASQSGLSPYVAVAGMFTLGCEAPSDKTGITVNSGESTVFDFSSAAVSSDGTAVLKRALFNGAEWKADGDGLYSFKPSDDAKRADFTLEYEVAGQTVALKGRFTCNMAVSVFTRYENVPWRDMKTAVKEYAEIGDGYRVEEKAVYKAEVPQNDEIDNGVYTFSVNSGVIQVEETATYLIYLKCKGMTRVDFGVPQYMFSMFEVALPVSDYTDLLYYEIELQQGVSYYYDIYILATKGDAYACLGICKKGGTEIADIDDSYLVYHSFDRDDISGYEAPFLVPESFGVKKEGRKHFENLVVNVIDYPEAEKGSTVAAATDGNDDTSFTSKESDLQVYVFEFSEKVLADYVMIKTGAGGMDYLLEYGVDGENYSVCDKGTVSRNIEAVFAKSEEIKYVRLTLSSDVAFASVIKDVYAGVYEREATIVPSNSSKVLYQGKWQYKTGGVSVNGWILESYGDDAAIEFNFYGTGISVYCAKGDVYGSMQIYVDGKQYGAVELNSAATLYDCNVFSIDFASPGKHKIRLVPSSNDDIINLDYFTVVYAEQDDASPEAGNLWYFAIIPAALLVIFAICAALDIADRRNKRRKMLEKSGLRKEEKADGEDGADDQA